MRVLLLFFLLLPGASRAQSLFDSTYTVTQSEVFFDFGKSELTPAAAATLDSVSALVSDRKEGLRVRITAHTDAVGDAASNLRLSRQRAESVYNGLQRRGLTTDDITISPMGESDPAADNDTESGRQRNRRATVEIFRTVPMTEFKARITDKESGAGIPGVTVYLRSKLRQDSTRTDTQGYYRARLPKDSVVKIEAVATNYFFQSMAMKVFGSPELYEKYKLNPNIELPPVKIGEKAVVRDLFFVGNQAVLLKSSEPELPKVLRFMQLNDSLRIEIAGHINQPGVPADKLSDWEWNLSEDRARLVYDYLLSHNIPADRMQYKGYGNTEMLFPYRGATEEQQQQNRRVEIRVIGKD